MTDRGGPTRLTRVAGWCLWITVWGPIVAILKSFQIATPYSFYVTYRKVVFVALVVQLCASLAVSGARSAWLALGLCALAVLLNPMWMVHFGAAWPWRLINVATVALSFTAMTHVHDIQSATKDPSEAGSKSKSRA